jgi:hypothetical protein
MSNQSDTQAAPQGAALFWIRVVGLGRVKQPARRAFETFGPIKKTLSKQNYIAIGPKIA